MDGNSQRNQTYSRGILSLWWNWAISIGMLNAMFFIGLLTTKVWLPLVAFAFNLALVVMMRQNRTAEQPVCYMIPFVAARALFWSATVMVIINFMNTHWFPQGYVNLGEDYNPSIPFISVLIVAPITMASAAISMIRGRNMSFCADCHIRHGSSSERGLLGSLYSQEADFQVRILFWISLFETVLGWLYYVFFYINTDMNTPDNFVFRGIPLLIYAATLGYLGLRYVGVWQYYCQDNHGDILGHGRFSMLRYIVMWEDSILLVEPQGDNRNAAMGDMRLDTPAKLRIPYRERLTEHDSITYFRNLSNVDTAHIRFLYINDNYNTDSNMYHYACFLDDPAVIEGSRLNGKWYTLPQIQRLNGEGRVSSAITSEIKRIYTISMAWKTYDRQGRRLYDIKHYKPTFRLRDLRKWDVDLNDTNWLFVADHNEDSRFYRLKRFWRKYINGIGE